MKNTFYTLPLKSEILFAGLKFEIQNTRKLIDKKIGIIKSIEKDNAELTSRQYAYSETLRAEGKQLIALIDCAENLAGSFVDYLNQFAEKQAELQKIIRSQETIIVTLELLLAHERIGKEVSCA